MNMLYKKQKKAGMSVSILLLVLATAGLIILFLITANNRLNNIDKKITDVQELPNFYSDADIFKFYLYGVAKEVLKENPAIGEQQFVKKFQLKYLELSNLNYREYTVPSLENQIKNVSKYDVKISFNEDKKTLTLKIKDILFEKNFDSDEISAIKTLNYTRDILFEIDF